MLNDKVFEFDNLLPEEALRSIIAKEVSLNAGDAFGLLAYFGAESAGSLVLRDCAHPSSAEHGIKPLPLAELSRRILNLPRASLTKDGGDNHLKNISFLVDAGGINVAPAYDLLSTAVYDTRAFGNDIAKWPNTPLAFSLGNATTFADVTRDHLLAAARALGLAERTATRELNRMVKAIPSEADKLIAEITVKSDADIAACPDPDAARQYLAGEQRMLQAIRHIVLAEMCRQMSPPKG